MPNVIHTCLIARSLLFTPTHARAQAYPDHAIRVIVGFTPGSATDVSARMFAQKLTDAWNVPVTVENIPGAGGSVGAERVARSTPDGYTLYWGANGAMTINPSLQPSPSFDPARDLAPIARLLVSPSILAVNNDVPAKTVGELIALARAQPGKLSYASPGSGTPQHIAGEVFKTQLGLDIVHVPYRGSAAAYPDLMSGKVHVLFDNLPGSIEFVRTGKLRALGVTTAKRSDALPDIPAIGEVVPGYEASVWYGIAAPKGTPPEAIEVLNKALAAALADPKMQARIAELGGTPMPMSPAEFGRLVADETEKWGAVVRSAGLSVE